MRPSKSVNSFANHPQHQTSIAPSNGRRQPPEPSKSSDQASKTSGAGAPTSPICRCRVMYLGSSVPHITKDGLQGIQEPLRELYPLDQVSLSSGNAGIDSWLSVWSNGILIENVDETGREVKRFFKIDALHYCAAVKYVPNPQMMMMMTANGASTLPTNGSGGGGNQAAALPKFLPLDSPYARAQQSNSNPPIFASILRRTTGVKVLECHAFICKREAAANALVRCCFHAYADTMYAKQIGADVDSLSQDLNNNIKSISKQQQQGTQTLRHQSSGDGVPSVKARRSKSIAALNDANSASEDYSMNGDQHDSTSTYSNATTMRGKSLTDSYDLNGNLSENKFNNNNNNNHHHHQQALVSNNNNSNLLKQHNNKLSKSMHHLNQPQDHNIYGRPGELNTMNANHATSFHNLSRAQWQMGGGQQPNQMFPNPMPPQPQPFFTPEASRVPSYPPPSMMDQQQQANNSGTLRSVKSITGNSIASTLLRSKKHAKAMSMAQLNQQQQQQQQQQLELNKINSFHQHPYSNGSTLAGNSFLLPPVPPMFLPPTVPRPLLVNGSQTMKVPRNMLPLAGAPMNFEAMTPKEMKKLLKKSAKYGIDPTRFSENGLPMFPLRPLQMPPPPPLPLPPHQFQMTNNNNNKSGTLGGQSMYSIDSQLPLGPDVPDFATLHGLPHSPPNGFGGPGGLVPDFMGGQGQGPAPMKSILVKPNAEFLKSKAGKKWLKQQKEFKKLLPPHLDGLPIVFGPPPIDALEPAPISSPNSNSNNNTMQQAHFMAAQPPPPPPPHPGLPMMDSSGFYNPHPFYGPTGRASAASTMLKGYSPHSQLNMQDNVTNQNHHHHHPESMNQRNQQAMYQNNMLLNNPSAMLQSQPHLMNAHDPESTLIYGNTELGTFDRQYLQFNGSNQPHHHRHQKRNHMVEQSVISLGDENDELEDDDDDDDDGGGGGQSGAINRRPHNHHMHDGDQDDQDDDDDEDDDRQLNGYYDRVESTRRPSTGGRSGPAPANNSQISRAMVEGRGNDTSGDGGGQHPDYEQVMSGTNDDQSSYSSGLYRREHLNERAFSYSIRQEHRQQSSGGSQSDAADYSSGGHSQVQPVQRRHQVAENQYRSQHITYDEPHSSNTLLYHQNNNNNNINNTRRLDQQQSHPMANGQYYQPQDGPVDKLAARMDSQLNMKSFSNSRIKSHM